MPVTDQLWAWYHAGQGVTGTTAVTQWNDLSGNNHHLVNGSLEPSLVTGAVNNLPAIYSDGTSGTWLQNTDAHATLPEVTVYIVAKQVVGDPANGPFLSMGDAFIVRRYGGTEDVGVVSGGQVASRTSTDNLWLTVRVRINANEVTMALNNGSENTINRQGYTNAAPLLLFNRNGVTGKKYIAEVLIYSAEHDNVQVAAVETYLRNKYNHY